MPLNLMISLTTLSFALLARGTTLSVLSVEPYWPEIGGLVCGGVMSAAYGAHLVHTLTIKRLVQIIAALLAGIGLLLLSEGIHPGAPAGGLRFKPDRMHQDGKPKLTSAQSDQAGKAADRNTPAKCPSEEWAGQRSLHHSSKSTLGNKIVCFTAET
jgi:hypothetical protein